MTARLVRAVAAALALAALLLAATAARSHELSMAELQVREVAPGEFSVQWGPGEKSSPAQSMRPQWPAHCTGDGAALRCGPQGLQGQLAMQGVGDRYSAALVKIAWLDGASRVYTLTAAQPSVQLFGSAEDRRGVVEVGRAYLVLGVEHILGGFDHLLFVVSLLFLVGFQRRLVWTITAFTVAHSVTLAAAATGWLVLRSPPVEATIALSIVLVAGEALHRRDTLARRWPALVAFAFGLVHGLGFAGALAEIGLPQNHLALALLAFNLGVEGGQLLVVALAWLAWRGLARWPAAAAARVPALYAIGSVAAYWSIGRVMAIVA